MKIGEFAERFGVGRDTVRHYCKLGLLIPDTTGMQACFTERECRDMEQILRMKKRKFSLPEIRKYFDVLRVSNMTEPESVQDIVEMFTRKRDELETQARAMLETCAMLDRDMQELSSRLEAAAAGSGVPLSALSLLTCPFCGQSLELENAFLNQSYIYQGKLCCRCGYQAEIEDGIVQTGNLYTGVWDAPDLHRGLYRDVSEDFVILMQRCTDYVLRILDHMEPRCRIVLESHINGYFFLYNNLRHLEPESTYIIVDKYPEMLRMYKRNIDRLGLRLNILYIADATMNWPLRHGVVDVLLDFMGGNEHSLYFKNAYIRDVKPFLRADAIVLGTALGFHWYAGSLKALRLKYPEGDGNGFCIENFAAPYHTEGYRVDQQSVGSMYKTYNRYSFSCHIDGEELVLSRFMARPIDQKTE